MRVTLDLNNKISNNNNCSPKINKMQNSYHESYKKPIQKAFAPANLSLISFYGKLENNEISPLQKARLNYDPKLPAVFKNGEVANASVRYGDKTESVANKDQIKELFPNTYGQPIVSFKPSSIGDVSDFKENKPLKVAVVLSGGQASGGHNVITGLYDSLKTLNPQNELYGFLGGPSGLVDNKYIKFTDKKIDEIRNTGGFDVIGSGRTKLEKEEQFEKVLDNCKNLGINAITIIGGDDSNTNAAVLAEWLVAKDTGINVVGCPKTIDGDLKNDQIETSFGFDTATKTFSATVGDIEKDALSAKKYWHFVKVMGRSASHVALEIALQTHPNITLISEEVEKKNMSLDEVVNSMANVIAKRGNEGKNYGIAVIPEGVIEFIPEMKSLISNLNELTANEEVKQVSDKETSMKLISEKLPENDSKVFNSLPKSIKEQLLMDRDSHGNVQVSKIDTEKLLMEMVKKRLDEMKEEGTYNGKFSAQNHFLGYEGRCPLPSNFDADYCYSLGTTAAALLNSDKTGYMATVKNLTKNADDWQAGGTPITMMLNMERRSGKDKPVIKKALVELDSPAFKEFEKNRANWAKDDEYRVAGSIQYFGPSEVCDAKTKTLELENQN